ncbi:MFS transporter [Methanogenium sp. S4BF]|uniref:MFS transporter n=1 Tax=Methanogenium sp. S4BF TaxID=1789226 RepID=UPI00241628E6|nr:MFS transporter [Methanogenium sp. S4BF]WFN34017.1 MFS transporter [Methanogenium sp. S4BF]
MDSRSPPSFSRKRLRAILIASSAATFILPFIGSAINIALPLIAAEFMVDADLVGWIPTAYLLASAIFLIPFGRIADTLGQRQIFLIGILVMAVSLGGAALSPGFWPLFGMMFAAGIGSAMIYATGIALLTMNYPLRERGTVIGINTSIIYIALSAGPFIGGIISGAFGWRAVFALAAGIAVLSFIPGVRDIPATRGTGRQGGRFDYPGALIYASALILLITGLSRIPDLQGGLLAAAGTAGLGAFLWWEARVQNPIFAVRAFAGNRIFTYSNIAALISYAATFAIGFLLSFYLQGVRGFSPGFAGIILITQPAVMTLVVIFSGRLSDRVEPRIPATAGMAIVAGGLAGFALLGPNTSLPVVAGLLIVVGCGFGIFSSPNMNSIISALPDHAAGVASATAATMRVVGQMLSMAIAMMIFSIVIGGVEFGPAVTGELLLAVQVCFAICAGLCGAGIWFSAARGNLRDE